MMAITLVTLVGVVGGVVAGLKRAAWFECFRTEFALVVIGVVSLILVAISAIIWAVEAEGFWPTLGVIFIGTPIALFLASWPIALGQMMRAVADIGDSVAGRGPVV